MIKLFSCEFFANFFNGFAISPDFCVFDGMAEKLNFFKEFVACKKNVTDYYISVHVCPWMVLKLAERSGIVLVEKLAERVCVLCSRLAEIPSGKHYHLTIRFTATPPLLTTLHTSKHNVKLLLI